MLKNDYGIFLGREEEHKIIEFIAGDNFFIIFKKENDSSKEVVRLLLKQIQDEVSSQKPQSLSSFDELVNNIISKHLKEDIVTFSCGLLVDEVLYLKTVEGALIYLYRDNTLVKLISSENTASGFIKHNDLFIFTVDTFTSLITIEDLKKRLIDRTPKEIVDEVTPLLKEKDDSGTIALFVRFIKEPVFVEETESTDLETTDYEKARPEKMSVLSQFKNKYRSFAERAQFFKIPSSRNKKLTLIAAAILFIILAWSIVFGYQRRANTQRKAEVKKSTEIIDQKLSEAADVSLLNMQRAQILLTEAKNELDGLKKKIGTNENESIQKIEQNIANSEKEILKREDKKAEVFYDLKLIEDNAKAIRMYKDKDSIALLNSVDGKIYTLNLDKKATRSIKKDEIKRATLVAMYNDEVFFFNPEKGIYKIDKSDKLTEAVKKDDEWGKISGLWIYNGNLYILDTGKDEIYKYLVAESGYSAKSSYFKNGQAIQLADTASMSIDSSLYIASSEQIFKYVSGAKDQFKVTFPDEGIHSFTKIFTDKNTNKVYALDKDKAKLYVLSKEGQYEKQIESSIFKSASDLVIYDPSTSVYVLVGDKIYKITI